MDGNQFTDAPDHGTSANPESQQEQDFQRLYEETKQSYDNLRPEYTRATQELSQLRDSLSEYEQLFDALHDPDPEVKRAAMEALGIDVETGSHKNDDEFVDPLEQELQELRQAVDDLQSERELEASVREQEERNELRDEFIGEAISLIEDNLKQQYGSNFRFSEKEEQALGNLAIAMEDENGVPDVEGAYNLLFGNDGVLEINRSRWIDSKRTAAVPPAGTSIPADKKPQTRAERIAWIDQRLHDLENQR